MLSDPLVCFLLAPLEAMPMMLAALETAFT